MNGLYALHFKKSFVAQHENMTKHKHSQQQKCSLGALVSGNVRFLRIFAGVSWRGASNDIGVSETAIFIAFAGYVFGEIMPTLL